MSKKYLPLYLVALIVISGCVETQAEKVGWNQAKYEEYSAYYDVLRLPPESTVNLSERIAISKNMTIDEWLISIPKDKNEFEMTWYLVFYNIEKAMNTPSDNVKRCSSIENPMDRSAGTTRMIRLECQNRETEVYKSKVNASYLKATEYRQKIEDIRMNISR